MHHRTRRSLVALTALLALATGCSDDSGGDDEGSKAEDTPTAQPTATDPATDPNSPFVVAATAVATRSLDQVTLLHVMGTATVEESELPSDQIPDLAGQIRTELGKQVADATLMTPPKGSAAEDLVSALNAYRTLAGELAEWKPASGRPLPAAWFDRLRGIDRDWKAALGKLGDLSGEDLLGNVPPLKLPRPA
jgi:hypothetical protein